MMYNKIERIKNSIANGMIKISINTFKSMEIDDEFENELIMHELNYKLITNNSRKNIISEEEKRKGIVKISNSLLELLRTYEESLGNVQTSINYRNELDEKYPIQLKSNLESSPFVGLRSYTKHEHKLYFGREKELLEFITKIDESPNDRILFLYGPSGVGKSSLLKAGIIPRLNKKYKIFFKRRNYTIGYANQLQNLINAYEKGKEIILILDQVEEIYTYPNPKYNNEEIEFFSLILKVLHREVKHIRIILSFRKEYFTDINYYFKNFKYTPPEIQLFPLNKGDMSQILKNIQRDRFISKQFKLVINDNLIDAMVDAIYRENENHSHFAPLLQLQLTLMWDIQKKKQVSNFIFDKSLYEQFEDFNLDDMIEFQLDSIQNNPDDEELWNYFLEIGLINDLLNFLVTSRLTAAEKSLDTIFYRYKHLKIDKIRFLISNLDKCYLVNFFRKAATVRLAHDQLASIIRKRFSESKKLGQRAWRLIEPKIIDLENSINSTNIQSVKFSEVDLELIIKGKDGMPSVNDELNEIITNDYNNLNKTRKKRFANLIISAKNNVANLEYQFALDALNNSYRDYRETEELELLHKVAFEIPYFFGMSNNDESLQAWLKLALNIKLINKSDCEFFASNKKFIDWFKKFNKELFQFSQRRHLPKFVSILGGAYNMGSMEGIPNHELPLHSVKVSSFKMSEAPITFWQYGLYCAYQNLPLPKSPFKKGQNPVINISWYDAITYCNWLSRILGFEEVYSITNELKIKPDWKKNGFRLPTEAEWEFAARERGKDITKVRFGNGKLVAKTNEMNFDATSHFETHRTWVEFKGHSGQTNDVYKFKPNELGLYDMSGNVFEWCWDLWSEGKNENNYYVQTHNAINPKGPTLAESANSNRVVKGGPWIYSGNFSRASYRYNYNPNENYNYIGFRVVQNI